MKFDYEVLVAVSPLPRGEFLNIGLVVWRSELPEIHAAVTPQRLAALDPNFPRLPVFKTLMAGNTMSELTPLLEPARQAPDALRMMLDLLIAPMKRGAPGEIYCDSAAELDERIERLLEKLVRRPVMTVPDASPRSNIPRTSRLNGQLKHWFKSAHILSRNAADLSRSKVVENFPISASHDLYAEFALKNGAVHVVETLDLRHHGKINAFVQKEAAIKAITLDQARQMLGAEGKRIAVIAADDYGTMRPAIGMLSGYADDVVTMASQADRQRFADFIATALHSDTALIALPA